MRLIGMMPCRNEAWILNCSARAALKWCDAVVILEHACTDGTAEIVAQLQGQYGNRVIAIQEEDSTWREMDHRQRVLRAARENGASHLAVVDADEVLTGNLLEWIRVGIESLPPGRMLQLPGYNLRGGLDRFHANGIWGDRWFSVAFKDDARLNWAGDRFHQREPNGMALGQVRPIGQTGGGIMHLWGASERRLKAKHCAYKMIETLRWPTKPHAEIDRLYNLAFMPSANLNFTQHWRYAEVPAEWWEPFGSLRTQIELDAVPWQEAMCQELYQLHGPARFEGLGLFDVCKAEAV